MHARIIAIVALSIPLVGCEPSLEVRQVEVVGELGDATFGARSRVARATATANRATIEVRDSSGRVAMNLMTISGSLDDLEPDVTYEYRGGLPVGHAAPRVSVLGCSGLSVSSDGYEQWSYDQNARAVFVRTTQGPGPDEITLFYEAHFRPTSGTRDQIVEGRLVIVPPGASEATSSLVR
ncbi:MAG: hypothetical protein KF901_12020 [Myxococcales bacterium]|nr:hypothetical protein [Myxococcales bacterium]